MDLVQQDVLGLDDRPVIHPRLDLDKASERIELHAIQHLAPLGDEFHVHFAP